MQLEIFYKTFNHEKLLQCSKQWDAIGNEIFYLMFNFPKRNRKYVNRTGCF